MPRRFFHAQKEVTEVPNEENLIPVRSERKRAKGGKASGEARRKKKELRETMEALLQAAGTGNEWLGFNRLLDTNIRKTI